MENKIYFLSTCETCKRIIKELNLKEKDFEFIDIKNKPISKVELEYIKNSTNSNYEDLFNKRSRKYNKDEFNSEQDYKQGILTEYTFLKRPIIEINNKFFIGNSKKIVERAKEEL